MGTKLRLIGRIHKVCSADAYEEFPDVDIICIGSMWNCYTPDAKKVALQKKLGLYRIDELKGGIYFDKFWLYHKKDEDGNPTYCFGSLR